MKWKLAAGQLTQCSWIIFLIINLFKTWASQPILLLLHVKWASLLFSNLSHYLFPSALQFSGIDAVQSCRNYILEEMAPSSGQMSVRFCHTTGYYIPQCSTRNLHSHYNEKLKPFFPFGFSLVFPMGFDLLSS